jgi:hypothetical protein
MITTAPFSFIHSRELVPADGPMATPIFSIICLELPPWILYAQNRYSAKSIVKYIDEVSFKPLPSGEVPLLNVPATEPPEMRMIIQRKLVPNDADRITIQTVYQELIAIDKRSPLLELLRM